MRLLLELSLLCYCLLIVDCKSRNRPVQLEELETEGSGENESTLVNVVFSNDEEGSGEEPLPEVTSASVVDSNVTHMRDNEQESTVPSK